MNEVGATEKRKNQPLPWKTLAIVFVVTLVISGIVLFFLIQNILQLDAENQYTSVVLENNGGVRDIVPPRQVQDFTLTSNSGEPVSLSDFEGKPLLFYFGYTHCPDVCPISLNDMMKVREFLGDQSDDVSYLFISVDGQRDTPEQLNNFFAMRDVEDVMVGMQGDDDVLGRVGADYGLYYELQPPDENGYYAVDHTANMYLLDQQGQLITILAYGTEPELIAERIRKLLAES
ncbi:MAG: SCO family protein [Anaerolineae bacterium]|nr:SCO family protein [Anaerolineae bacterium]